MRWTSILELWEITLDFMTMISKKCTNHTRHMLPPGSHWSINKLRSLDRLAELTLIRSVFLTLRHYFEQFKFTNARGGKSIWILGTWFLEFFGTRHLAEKISQKFLSMMDNWRVFSLSTGNPTLAKKSRLVDIAEEQRNEGYSGS